MNNTPGVISQSMIDEADDLLLETVRTFVEVHGGIPNSVGGVELMLVSARRFVVCVHCEGIAPPMPGAPADA